jgi:hypothetical protein
VIGAVIPAEIGRLITVYETEAISHFIKTAGNVMVAGPPIGTSIGPTVSKPDAL